MAMWEFECDCEICRKVREGLVKVVIYHSPRWMDLVEQGWVTVDVNDGWARMIRENK